MNGSRKRPPEEGNEGAEKREKRNKDAVRTHKLHGLYNQGATCYLNSVLQVLSMTTEIHKRLNTSLPTDQELRNIFERLKKKTCGTEIIAKSLDITNVHQQCDAAECLEMILHKVSPEASEVFRGELKFSTKCSKGHSIIEETNPFLTLPLSLKDAHDSNYSVEIGFERIFQKKSFIEDNMVYCNKCTRKTDAISKCEMVTFPKILTLLLKRFVYDYNTRSHVKSDHCVDVPCELNINNKKYRLYGMVNHMGGLRGGHYTATILSNEDQTWYEFNDTHVEKVDEQPFAKNKTYNSRTAYLLMYRTTESPSTNRTERQDEVSVSDEPKGNKVKGNSHPKQNQEKQLRISKAKKKDPPNPKVRAVEGDERSRKVSRLGEDIIKADNAVHQNQISGYSSRQHPKTWTPEARRTQSRKKYDVVRPTFPLEENPQQPCKRTASILKKPLVIVVIVFVCALIVILPVVLTTLRK